MVSIVLACLGYINDVWLRFSYIGSDLMPTYAFGLLLLALLVANPLLRRWRFKAGELVTMLALAMMGSTLAGSAFFWTWPHPMIVPIDMQAGNVGWQHKDVIQYAPPPLMVDTEGGSEVVAGYMRGIENTDKLIDVGPLTVRFLRFSKVPWGAWRASMAFWTAALSLTFIASICAIVIVHRQWSKREHLAYPIAAFTEELLRSDDSPVNPIFRNRVFWGGFALSFVVLIINGYHAWDRGAISVPTVFDFRPLAQIPFIKQLTRFPFGGDWLLNIHLFFSAIGLAYFLSSEASFSMGISSWVFALAILPFTLRGVDFSGGILAGYLQSYLWFGAFLGMGMVVLYLGRRFYASVFRRAASLRARRGDDVLPREVWAARILIVVWAVTVLLLWGVGLHPLLGIAFVLLCCLLFVMLARLHVATGLFVIQPLWHPVSILLGLFGAAAMGPHALAILALLSSAIAIDPRIAVAPLVANILRLSDGAKVSPGRTAAWMGVAIVVSLVIALTFTVWFIYGTGVETVPNWDNSWAKVATRMPFRLVANRVNELDGVGVLAQAEKPTTVGRLLGQMKPTKHFFRAMAIGMALVMACSYLRLRYAGWPLHPLMFLVWGQPWMSIYAPSFLLAWLIKSVIMRFGGRKGYRSAKPFFVGLVAGEFLAAILLGVAGVIVYWLTGEPVHFIVRR